MKPGRGTARLRRAGLTVLALSIALAAAGCGVAERRAKRYRAEQVQYAARLVEREARLGATGGMAPGGGRGRPDSTTLLRVRKEYMRVQDVVPPPYIGQATGRTRQMGRDVLRAVATGVMDGARVAMFAGRADLALGDSKWLREHAEGDTMVARQADFLAIGALRTMGKTDEAVAHMHEMLQRYEPMPPPPGTDNEDALLSVPEMLVTLRREVGDQAGAARERDFAAGYLHGLLQKPRQPLLEAQIRSRLVRLELDRNNGAAALEQVDAMERLVQRNPSLQPLEPELVYSRAKIRAMTGGDRSEAVAMLARFASDYPRHPLAPRALFDAAVYLEDMKQLPDALSRYREVIDRYPGNEELAPVALFRQAMLEEQLGDWNRSKSTLESIPVKYPGSQAAVEAPFTVAQRYYARGDREASKTALARAVTVYREMVARDSNSVYAPVARFYTLRALLSLGQWDQALAAVDELALRNPRHPYTADALLEGARVANANHQRDRAAGYLQQYLENFPNSPAAAQVRHDKDRLLQ
ncbi:MAG TPA: tetratricopeptide repeat protein [Candidatus Eisenbacteria bacterium]|nr:tetratricopeptide repeat protein [Candidatus Eisenbacteria bacterium]